MIHASLVICKSVNTKIGYHRMQAYYLLRDKVLLLSTGSVTRRPMLLYNNTRRLFCLMLNKIHCGERFSILHKNTVTGYYFDNCT